MKLSELLELPVRDESGRELGRVHDVRAGDDQTLEALVVGRRGLLVRLGVTRSGTEIPWSDVVSVGDAIVVSGAS